MCSEDRKILRELVKQMLEITALPANQEKRELWRRHFSLQETRPLILASFGMHNVWCHKAFGDEAMQCSDPFLRQYERVLRMSLFRAQVGDDCIFEPWLEVEAVKPGDWNSPWGLEQGRVASDVDGGAWQYDPPLREWSDIDRLKAVPHRIDEARTEANRSRLYDAVCIFISRTWKLWKGKTTGSSAGPRWFAELSTRHGDFDKCYGDYHD